MTNILVLSEAINNVDGKIDTLFADHGYDSKGLY